MSDTKTFTDVIATIKATNGCDIHMKVVLPVDGEVPAVDIRAYYAGKNGDALPSKSGIRVDLANLSELIEDLQFLKEVAENLDIMSDTIQGG